MTGQNDRRADFAQLIVQLGVLYGKDLSTLQIELYWRALCHLPMEAIMDAAAKHARDPERGRWMPLPADFVAAIEGTRQQRAMRQLVRVRQAMRSAGASRSVCFDDPAVMLTLQHLQGWERCCAANSSDPAEFERRWMAAYAGICDDEKTVALAPKVLEGGDARIARSRDKPAPPPLYLQLAAIASEAP